MVHVLGEALGAVKPEGVRSATAVGRVEIRVIVQEGVAQAVHGGCTRKRVERRLTGWVERIRIGSEIVVEGLVLPENDHNVFDGSRCFGIGSICYRRQHWPGNYGGDETDR